MKRITLLIVLVGLPSLLAAGPIDDISVPASEEPDSPVGPLLLSFTGDIMAHSINYEMEDYASIYRGIGDIILHDDLTFGNLELPVDIQAPQMSFPSFNVHRPYVEAAVEGGIEVLSLANNHSMDQGETGLQATLSALNMIRWEHDNRLWTSGIKRPADSWEVTEIRLKGWRIGFLAVTQYSNISANRKTLRVVDYRKSSETEEFIKWVADRSGAYDLFIVSYHGGIEYAREPDEMKSIFFHDLVDAGVDIVYGHHPHVLQPAEFLRTDTGEAIIINSCGNLISGQNRIMDPAMPAEEWSYTGDSAIFRIEVASADGAISLGIRKPVLIGNIITPDRDVVILPLETAAETLRYGGWGDFYLRRLEIMAAWLEDDFLVETAIQ